MRIRNVFIIIIIYTEKPSAPQNIRVTAVSKDSVSLAWDEPVHNGGAPVTRYVVERADVKQNVFSEVGNTTADRREITVTNLLEGNQYMFRVAAENDVGLGKPASLAEPVTARRPFGQLHLHPVENKIILSANRFIWLVNISY